MVDRDDPAGVGEKPCCESKDDARTESGGEHRPTEGVEEAPPIRQGRRRQGASKADALEQSLRVRTIINHVANVPYHGVLNATGALAAVGIRRLVSSPHSRLTERVTHRKINASRSSAVWLNHHLVRIRGSLWAR
jgi:hypothetical protein